MFCLHSCCYVVSLLTSSSILFICYCFVVCWIRTFYFYIFFVKPAYSLLSLTGCVVYKILVLTFLIILSRWHCELCLCCDMSRICVVVLFVILKGVFHELFDLQCFHDSNPSGPLINRLKDYLIRILFCRYIRSLSSTNSTPWGASHSWVSIWVVYQKMFFKCFFWWYFCLVIRGLDGLV